MTDEEQKIIGERILLRPLTLADASDEYLSWLNDAQTNKYLETRRETMEGLKAYVAARSGRKDVFFAGIFDKATGAHIGNVKLEPIDLNKKTAVFGILIGNPAYRGKGIGTEATNLVVKYAFEDLQLHDVELGVIAENMAGGRAYEKAGFVVEKIEKGTINHD